MMPSEFDSGVVTEDLEFMLKMLIEKSRRNFLIYRVRVPFSIKFDGQQY